MKKLIYILSIISLTFVGCQDLEEETNKEGDSSSLKNITEEEEKEDVIPENNDMRLIKIEYWVDGNLESVDEFKYNDKNQIIEYTNTILFFYGKNGKEYLTENTPKKLITYEYENDNIISTILSSYDNEMKKNTRYFCHEYNSDNLLVKTISFDKKAYGLYTYNESNLPIKIILYDNEGNESALQTFDYLKENVIKYTEDYYTVQLLRNIVYKHNDMVNPKSLIFPKNYIDINYIYIDPVFSSRNFTIEKQIYFPNYGAKDIEYFEVIKSNNNLPIEVKDFSKDQIIKYYYSS